MRTSFWVRAGRVMRLSHRHHTGANPLLKAPVTGLERRVSPAQAQLRDRDLCGLASSSLTAQLPDGMTRIASRSRTDYSVIIAVIVAIIIVPSAQVVLIDCSADSLAQASSCRLVGSKMYPAINASVGNIVGNLPERGVLQNSVRHCWV
jgi:hypothetical protein